LGLPQTTGLLLLLLLFGVLLFGFFFLLLLCCVQSRLVLGEVFDESKLLLKFCRSG
jgi:hypothetical protein